MTLEKKRKNITPKNKLKVFKRDNYSCKFCGRNPGNHNVEIIVLEIDHILPFSCGGADELSNYQTLCLECNRGKGNNEYLNRSKKNELDSLLNYINPEILQCLNKKNLVSIVVNQEDYVKIVEINSYGNFYEITLSTNTILGFGAGKNLGIYTRHDNGGTKVNFLLAK